MPYNNAYNQNIARQLNNLYKNKVKYENACCDNVRQNDVMDPLVATRYLRRGWGPALVFFRGKCAAWWKSGCAARPHAEIVRFYRPRSGPTRSGGCWQGFALAIWYAGARAAAAAAPSPPVGP